MPSVLEGPVLPQKAIRKFIMDDGIQGGLPEFASMPSGKEPEYYSGLRRGALNQLVLPCPANDFKPPVKSITLRRSGCRKGPRLIVLRGSFGTQSGLLTYLWSKAEQEDAMGHPQNTSPKEKAA